MAAEKPVEIYDAILEAVEEIVEVEAEVEAEAEAVAPTAPAIRVPASAYAVVGNSDTDYVYPSKCVYKNMLHKKSLSVHHLQRRLMEWGYPDAYSDKDGYYGDPTKKSVAEFQSARGLEATGMVDYETLTLIFEGDTNVTVVKD